MSPSRKPGFTPAADKPVLLLIEGADAFYFVLSQFLKKGNEFAAIHLYDFGSISELKLQMETLFKAPGFKECIKAVGVMRDAEDNANSATSSVREAFESVGIEAPASAGEIRRGAPACGFYLFPDNANPGCLENACLNAYGNPEDVQCAKAFLDCAERGDKSPNWQAKTLVHALIAIGDKPELTLGDSAKTGLWNPQSHGLVRIKSFLQNLCDAVKPQHGTETESFRLQDS